MASEDILTLDDIKELIRSGILTREEVIMRYEERCEEEKVSDCGGVKYENVS